MLDRPTFSPFWHRVRQLRPRLRPHVQITRQHYRGGRWHVVHDPASNAFYRLSPVSHEFVGLLDGKRTVEEVWELCLTRRGDDAPTQNEVIQLLSQLYSSNLLAADVTPETEQLLRRGSERRQKKLAQQLIGLMYFRVRLFNPNAILAWMEPLFRPLIGRVGFIAWLIWVGVGLGLLLPHWDRLASQFDKAIAPANWPWLIVVYVTLKLIHESGHGIICKRFGGQVPEFGAMFLVLVPSPYVDASSAWALPSKWKRMAVGAGGMIFELAVAAAAAHVWLNTGEALLAHQLAFNVMLTSGVSTILFNANPLMKFDGYYILSDLLETPNLMQRAFNMLKYQFQKYVYKVRNPVPPTYDPGEGAILNLYAWAALAYRIFLFFSITLYLMGKMFGLGLVLAAWTAAMWFLLPLGQFVHWVVAGPMVAEKRTRAIVASLAMVGVGLGLVGLIPVPDRRRAEGVVSSEQRTGVFFGATGFVDKVHRKPGEFVKAGEPIVTLVSDDLASQLRGARAALAEAEAMELSAIASNAAAAVVARDRVAAYAEQVQFYEDKIAKLVVRSPQDGVLVGESVERLLGALVKEGQPAGEVVDVSPARLRVASSLSQTEALWINDLKPSDYRVEARVRGQVDRVLVVEPTRIPQAGQKLLPHESLGYVGGGTMETEQQDRTGRLAKDQVFNAEFRFVEHDQATPASDRPFSPLGLPGERVTLRFTLPNKPLLAQWVDRVQKLMLGRARV